MRLEFIFLMMGRWCWLQRIFPLASGALHTFDSSDSSHKAPEFRRHNLGCFSNSKTSSVSVLINIQNVWHQLLMTLFPKQIHRFAIHLAGWGFSLLKPTWMLCGRHASTLSFCHPRGSLNYLHSLLLLREKEGDEFGRVDFLLPVG